MFDDLVAEAEKPPFAVRWFAEPQPYLLARWLWLRALGAIFFSAFYSLWFQIHRLIGPRGVLPAGELLPSVRRAIGLEAYWLIPSLLWIDAGDAMLTALYYENGPVPTWLGWHVQHWPQGFHAFTAAATLVVELPVVLLIFVPGKWPRRVCFAIVTPLQVGSSSRRITRS